MKRQRQTQPNSRIKKNGEKVKIHIFHFVAHTSIKSVIILVNLWHYSIVVIWHFVRSFVRSYGEQNSWLPKLLKRCQQPQTQTFRSAKMMMELQRKMQYFYSSKCILRTFVSVIKRMPYLYRRNQFESLLNCRKTNDSISLTPFDEAFYIYLFLFGWRHPRIFHLFGPSSGLSSGMLNIDFIFSRLMAFDCFSKCIVSFSQKELLSTNPITQLDSLTARFFPNAANLKPTQNGSS